MTSSCSISPSGPLIPGQDYEYDVQKRGGDARFATGVMGAGFNRISMLK